jgi:hypothetical protein
MPVNPVRKKTLILALIREISSHSPSQFMSYIPAEKRPDLLRDLDFERELKSAVDNILQACPQYTTFIVYMFYLLIRP